MWLAGEVHDSTNREIYLQVRRSAEGTSRSLEEYLRALWSLGRAERDQDTITPDVFVALLTEATSSAAPGFDERWRTADLGLLGVTKGFDTWERVILSQIADLRDFAEGPPQHYPELGVDAPRRSDAGTRANGLRWYNHSVPSYLECGMAGALGGWDPDDGIRTELPGPSLPVYPEPEGVTSLSALTWHELAEFLICGQEYE